MLKSLTSQFSQWTWVGDAIQSADRHEDDPYTFSMPWLVCTQIQYMCTSILRSFRGRRPLHQDTPEGSSSHLKFKNVFKNRRMGHTRAFRLEPECERRKAQRLPQRHV